jgi:YHS domain-containing protein/(2Fe-2S) ferredoxin
MDSGGNANGNAHGPSHVGTGCPTCDPSNGQPPARRLGLRTMEVQARGEAFRLVQLQGQLFVCTRQNGSCCCGWEEKGRLPFDPAALWGDEWERRKIRNKVHLTFTGCLGPCAAGNNALLHLHGRSIWFKDLNHPELARAVFDWIQGMLAEGRVTAPPETLRDHVYERFVPPSGGEQVPLVVGAPAEFDGLDRLDPVCLMEVDPATAKHTVEYAGRTIAFCAPSCRKQFLADPEAYLGS